MFRDSPPICSCSRVVCVVNCKDWFFSFLWRTEWWGWGWFETVYAKRECLPDGPHASSHNIRAFQERWANSYRSEYSNFNLLLIRTLFIFVLEWCKLIDCTLMLNALVILDVHNVLFSDSSAFLFVLNDGKDPEERRDEKESISFPLLFRFLSLLLSLCFLRTDPFIETPFSNNHGYCRGDPTLQTRSLARPRHGFWKERVRSEEVFLLPRRRHESQN